MSVFSVLTVGAGALQAQSDAISTISTNIANSNTTAYKEGVTSFADLVTDLSANNYSVNGDGAPDAAYTGSGVISSDTQLNDVQGLITGTNSPTDIAISGTGFFVVSPTATAGTANLGYTRAGSFVPDLNGNFANAAGDFLQAWPVDDQGNLAADLTGTEVASSTAIPALQTVNVKNLVPIPVPTTSASIRANLDASQAFYAGSPPYDPANNAADMAGGAITPDFVVPVSVVDSTGALHTLDVGFLKPAGILANSGAGPFSGVSAGSTTMTVTGPVPAGLAVGDTVSFTGAGAILDSNGAPLLNAGDINTSHTVLSVGSGSYTVSTVAANSVAQAVGSIAFAANPNAGDSITLNGQTWTFVSGNTAGPDQTAIQGSLSATLAQLASDLNASSDAALTGATYSVTPNSPNSTSLVVTYNTAGATGNTYTLASSQPNATPSGGTLTDGGAATTSNSGGLSTAGITGGTGTITQGLQNSWAVEVYANPASDVTAPNGQIATGTITFNSDGSLASVSPAFSNLNITWTATGSPPVTPDPSTIAMNWGTAGVPFGTPNATVIGRTDGLEQFDSAFDLISVQQNGVQADTGATTSISSSGLILINYSDGTTKPVYQIPLAQFTNPDGLDALSANVYSPTVASGTTTFFAPTVGTNTQIDSNSLESSNVDLATQLTNLIIAQDSYQSNSRLLSTSDSMLQTLVQMG